MKDEKPVDLLLSSLGTQVDPEISVGANLGLKKWKSSARSRVLKKYSRS